MAHPRFHLRIRVEAPGQAAEERDLEGPATIGRDASADIVLADARVSRRHAEIRPSRQGFSARDLGSGNGTALNGVPLSTETALNPGDCLSLGDSEIAIVAIHAHAASQGKKPLVLAALASLIVAGGLAIAFWPSPTDNKTPAIAGQSDLPVAEETQVPDAVYVPDEGTPALIGESDGQAAPNSEPDPVAAKDATDQGRFEEALAKKDWRQAASLAARLSAREEAEAALTAALDAEASALLAEFATRKEKEGPIAAARWLREQSRRIPDRTAARRILNEELLSVATGRPAPVRTPEVATGGNASKRPSSAEPQPAAGSKPAPESAPSGQPEKPTETAAREAIASAELAFKERRLADARAALESVRETFRESPGEPLFQTATKALVEVQAFEELIGSLVHAARLNPERVEGVSFTGPGQPGGFRVKSLSETGLRLEDKKGESKDLPWSLVPAKLVQTLGQKLAVLPYERLTIASLLRREGFADDSDKLLAKLHKEAPVLKPDIYEQLARARGMERAPADGFQWVDGAWLAPGEIDRAKLDLRVTEVLAQLNSEDALERENAFALLQSLGDLAAGRLMREIESLQTKLEAGALPPKIGKQMDRLRQARTEVDRLRKDALALIYDEQAYPYPYRPPAPPTALAAYQETQPKIDALVAELKTAYEFKSEVQLPSDLGAKLQRLEEIASWRNDLGLPERPVEPAWMMTLPKSGAVHVRNFAHDAKERERIDQSLVIMTENESVQGLSIGEVTQVRITNEYRMLFGHYALKISPELSVASRGHCDDMQRLGFFAHDSPVSGKETPSKRAKLAGFPSGAIGENLAISSGPAGAHQGWTHSPGHHRNLLNPRHRLMGIGNAARYWCQMFH